MARDKWANYCKRPFGGPERALKYIGRYTHRVAISNNRLINIKDGKIRFVVKFATPVFCRLADARRLPLPDGIAPYNRNGEIEDISRAAVRPTSDHSDYITGTNLIVDGGMMLYPGFATGG